MICWLPGAHTSLLRCGIFSRLLFTDPIPSRNGSLHYICTVSSKKAKGVNRYGNSEQIIVHVYYLIKSANGN